MPIVGRELVISGRDTSTLLDFVEEPFDEIARQLRLDGGLFKVAEVRSA